MVKNINELYKVQSTIWREENEHFFGLTPLNNWTNAEEVKKHLDTCSKKFWNEGTNELKKLLENGRCKDVDKLIPGTYELVFDHRNGIVCLYASFEYETVDKRKNNIKDENGNINNVKKIVKKSPLVYLPYVNDLCWFLNDTEYVLRISATINYSLITRQENICKYQRSWIYDIEKDEFTILNKLEGGFDPYEELTKENRFFLENCYGSEITKENFTEALKTVPEFDGRSIMYFRFEHVSEMFKLVTKSNRFANPLMRVPIPINIVKMFSSQQNRNEKVDNGSFNNLVLSQNKLFALENSRTVIYKSQFNTNFQFADSQRFFDAFKTSTNKSAGRSRLILDDVYVKNNMLYKNIVDENGNSHLINMFAIVLADLRNSSNADDGNNGNKNNNNDNDNDSNNNGDNLISKLGNSNNNLSVLSCSRFSSNNDAKRIMMTAKLRAQAIPTIGEIDPFTHETPARIVFGDFEGFNFGDSIIISKSFARKLESHKTIKRSISTKEQYEYLNEKYKVGDYMSVQDFSDIVGSFMYDNCRDIYIEALEREFITVSVRAPFSIGDKITNLHGSKGIVSLIFEDKDMPCLENDLGPNMKAGPMDVIVSGLSVYRRKSLGQIFEAWALATDRDDVNNIQDAVSKYKDGMKTFSENSIITFRGQTCVKPCGINMMIRLNHDSIAHQSRSYLKSNYGKMLKFGEMELLNLASRGLFDIMNELDIRSVSKHYNSFYQIKEMQDSGEIREEPANNLRFFNILRTMGFDFNLRKQKSVDEINPEFAKLQNLILTDSKINLFKDSKGKGLDEDRNEDRNKDINEDRNEIKNKTINENESRDIKVETIGELFESINDGENSNNDDNKIDNSQLYEEGDEH